MAIVTAGTAYPLDFRNLDLTGLLEGAAKATTTSLVIDYGAGDRDEFYGSGFTYNAFGEPTGGTITGYRAYVGNALVVTVEGAAASAVTFMSYVKSADTVGGVLYVLSGNDEISGSVFADYMAGGLGDDTLIGFGGNDTLIGNDGDDHLTGGAGNDELSGGAGTDTAHYSGVMANYNVVTNADGSLTITDLRANSPDGVDHLTGIEKIQFATAPSNAELTAQIKSILRLPEGASSQSAFYQDLLNKWNAGQLTSAQVTKAIVDAADATTSVASMSYQFFTGKVPTSLGFDFLVAPDGPNAAANLNSPLYAKFDVINRFINFAANLGKYGEAKDSFAAKYANMTLAEATKDAYAIIFGATPNDAKVAQLLNGRVDYLASFTNDTPTGIGTKAAMVGFLLAAAATENVGVMARSNDAWLTDLSDGSAPYAVNILDPSNGYYKTDFIYGA